MNLFGRASYRLHSPEAGSLQGRCHEAGRPKAVRIGYSYTIQSGPGKRMERPCRRRSRQFSQLWPSNAST